MRRNVWTTGDTAPALLLRLYDGDSAANLTAASALVNLRRPNGTVLTKTGTLVGDGTVSVSWLAADLDVSGDWRAEVQVTFADGTIQTFGPTSFLVRQQYG